MRLDNRVDGTRYLLCVILSQFLQLLTFVVFDAVQHGVNLFSAWGFFPNAARTTVLTDMIHDAQSMLLENRKFLEKKILKAQYGHTYESKHRPIA